MRKILLLSVAVLLAASAVPASAHEEPAQKVEGTIIGPPIPAKNVSGGGRRLVLLASEAGVNGVGGWLFDVNPATIGGYFELKPAGVNDVDVFFYSDLGDVGGTAPVITGQFSNEDANGEKGFVPEETVQAIVYFGPCQDCIPEGLPAAVSFVYTAEALPTVAIDGRTDLGQTFVHQGGSVGLTNSTATSATVSSSILNATVAPGDELIRSVASAAPGEYPFTVDTDGADPPEATGSIVIE